MYWNNWLGFRDLLVRLERRSCEEETERGERLGFETSSYDYTIHRWCCHEQQCICKLVSLRAPRNQSLCWGSPIYRTRYTSVEQHGESSVLLFLRMSTWRSSVPSFDFGDGYRLRSTRVRSLSLQPPQRWLVSYGMTMARDMMSFGIWRRMGLETWQIAGDGGNAGKMLQRLLLGRARMPSALTPSQLSALVLWLLSLFALLSLSLDRHQTEEELLHCTSAAACCS